ncbi:MAG: class I SAM-dependent RNA methyltransferase [Firmicutes bacterium]|nr:class I SAM-dependent RNA methyltransferase [Bacillota bacterium]
MDKILNQKIEKLDHFGRGIIKKDNDIIFVENALPNDIVDISITKQKKNIKEAEVTKYIERSNYYKDSICPYSNVCGGCNIINLIYNEQLPYKKTKVQELIDKMLRMDIKINEVISSNQEYNYRNKITIHSKDNQLGLYKKKSNDLVEINECKLVNEKINEILKRIKSYQENNKCQIADLIIKTTTLNESMISIYGSMDYEHFKKEFSDIKVIIINNQIITKDKYIKEKLLNKEFYISNHSFFQVNMYTTNLLYEKVIDLIKNKNYKTCLDLYCGTGTITILVSDYIDKVYGIEVVEDAVNDANKNKELNNKNNIEFILGKTEEHIHKFKDIDLIIVDPPREGLDKITKENLKRINPKTIIYVSCEPSTLMRDLNDLKDKYNIKEISICDMFPNTYHVESIALLTRKN